jgi:hypothetical protein
MKTFCATWVCTQDGGSITFIITHRTNKVKNTNSGNHQCITEGAGVPEGRPSSLARCFQSASLRTENPWLARMGVVRKFWQIRVKIRHFESGTPLWKSTIIVEPPFKITSWCWNSHPPLQKSLDPPIDLYTIYIKKWLYIRPCLKSLSFFLQWKEKPHRCINWKRQLNVDIRKRKEKYM